MSSTALDYLSVRPFNPLKVGEKPPAETVEILEDLVVKHSWAKHEFKNAQALLLPALLRFGHENIENEKVINEMLKEKSLSFNGGSSFWRKIALLWLGRSVDKSVITRYGQLLQRVHDLQMPAHKFYNNLRDYGYTEASRAIAKKHAEETRKLLPKKKKSTAVQDFRNEQRNALSIAKIENFSSTIASGYVNIAAKIEDDGTVSVSGIYPTTESKQEVEIEKVVKRRKPHPLESKSPLAYICKLPISARGSIKFDVQKGKTRVQIFGSVNEYVLLYDIFAPKKFENVKSTGHICGVELDRLLKESKWKSCDYFAASPADRGVLVEVGDAEEELPIWDYDYDSFLDRDCFKEETQSFRIWGENLLRVAREWDASISDKKLQIASHALERFSPEFAKMKISILSDDLLELFSRLGRNYTTLCVTFGPNHVCLEGEENGWSEKLFISRAGSENGEVHSLLR